MKLTRILSLATAGVLAVGLASCNSGQEPAEHDHSSHASEASEAAESHKGHDHGDHAADDATEAVTGLTKIEPSADYPLQTCVVSGEALDGSMGETIAYEFEGQEVQFCCEVCLDEFQESPAEFVAKVKAAEKK